MLNPFPHLLDYSFLTPTLLRIVVSIYFVYIAQHLFSTRSNLSSVRIPFVGKLKVWMVVLSSLVTILTAFLLFVGLWTQYAAILGGVIALKHTFMLKSLDVLRPLPRSTNILLAVICGVLLVTGAGAFAFDLPL